MALFLFLSEETGLSGDSRYPGGCTVKSFVFESVDVNCILVSRLCPELLSNPDCTDTVPFGAGWG